MIKEARIRSVHATVVEWPGGSAVDLDLEVSLALLKAVTQGRRSIHVPEDFEFAKVRGPAGGSVVGLHSGDQVVYRMVGPVQLDKRGLVLPVIADSENPELPRGEYSAGRDSMCRELGFTPLVTRK